MRPAPLLLLAGFSLTACNPDGAGTSAKSNIDDALDSNTAQPQHGALGFQDGAIPKTSLGWLAAGTSYLGISRTYAAKLSELGGQVRDQRWHDGPT